MKTDTSAVRLTSEVFGTSRRVPLSYTDRSDIDSQFQSVVRQGKHLIIFGASGQGKSALIRRHLDEKAFITVQCGPNMQQADVYRLLLSEAGVYVSLGRKKKRLRGVSAEITMIKEENRTESENSDQRIQIDLSNISDVLRMLRENRFNRLIVFEDFHILREQVQRQIAADLKAVYERSSHQVLIAGVWQETDKLAALSGYLAGRSVLVPVDAWEAGSLQTIIDTGCRLLNINIDQSVIERLVLHADGNVGMLQKLCYRVCELSEVHVRVATPVAITDPSIVDTAFRDLTAAAAGRFQLFIERYARRRTRSHKHMNKWIMHALIHIGADDLARGVSAAEILQHVNQTHNGCSTEESYDDDNARTYKAYRGRLDMADVRKKLSRINRYQRLRNVSPFILAYDKTRDRLRVVDEEFLMFLRSQRQESLLKLLPMHSCELQEEYLALTMSPPGFTCERGKEPWLLGVPSTTTVKDSAERTRKRRPVRRVRAKSLTKG